MSLDGARPDGIAEQHLFLEIDRSTESQSVLANRAACYRAHYRGGGFAESRGMSRANFEEFPFRVLAVFKSIERRNHATERLLAIDPPIKSMIWLTTIQELLGDPLSEIWVRPMDYKLRLANTGCPAREHEKSAQYRSQSDGNGFLEQNIRKNRLCGELILK